MLKEGIFRIRGKISLLFAPIVGGEMVKLAFFPVHAVLQFPHCGLNSLSMQKHHRILCS